MYGSVVLKKRRPGSSLLEQQILKAKEYIQIGIGAEDYYRIKDSEKEE